MKQYECWVRIGSSNKGVTGYLTANEYVMDPPEEIEIGGVIQPDSWNTIQSLLDRATDRFESEGYHFEALDDWEWRPGYASDFCRMATTEEPGPDKTIEVNGYTYRLAEGE